MVAQALANGGCWLVDSFCSSNSSPRQNQCIDSFIRDRTVCLFVCLFLFCKFMSCFCNNNNNFCNKIHYSRYFTLFPVLKRTSFFTPNRHGYSVQFSPFEAYILAVGKSAACTFRTSTFNYYAFPVIQSLWLLLLLLLLHFSISSDQQTIRFCRRRHTVFAAFGWKWCCNSNEIIWMERWFVWHRKYSILFSSALWTNWIWLKNNIPKR